jgi:hypothetical protein
LALTSSAALFAACSYTTANPECSGGKCDTPGSSADSECRAQCGGDSDCQESCREEAGIAHCEARRADAIDSGQVAFTEDAIRWACADVEGVNANGGDDRGQEYCEYFAVIQPPPKVDGDAPPRAVELGKNGEFGIELTVDQIFALEDEPDTVVGQCIFTSWHSDIDVDLPSCDPNCPEVSIADSAEKPSWMDDTGLEFPMTREMMQMTGSINSNGAAVDLVNRCITTTPSPPDALGEDDYTRGCWGAFELFQTEWRRSDPSICVASMRLGECGCALDLDGDKVADITDPLEIAAALFPEPAGADVPLRGFKLGTWSGMDQLPAGCRFLDTGDESQSIVGCDLTGTDLLTAASDPKERCRAKYGSNVVVHVPVPADLVLCEPPVDGDFTDSCGDMVPFAAPDQQDGGISGGQCCRTCSAGKACGNGCISRDAICEQPPGCACDA